MTARLRKPKCPFDGPEHRKARGPNGRRLCRWCGTEVGPTRQTWCGDACVSEYKALSNSGSARRFLINRDGAACTICGEDSSAIEKAAKKFWNALRWEWIAGGPPEIELAWAEYRSVFTAAGFDLPRGFSRYDTPWQSWIEVDHAIPLVEGGKHELQNLRIVCQPCHKRITAELAARRAEARR